MASRLERLVLLLDTGSTSLVRSTAADQIAEVQKSHPHEFYNLLGRVIPFLQSANWDTRLAAAKAIGGIADHAIPWDPNSDDQEPIASVNDEPVKDNIKSESEADHHSQPAQNGNPDDSLMSTATFDLVEIIKSGKFLVGSVGKEYDVSHNEVDVSDRLATQKRNVAARLGLGGEYVEDELVDDTDFAVPQVKSENRSGSIAGVSPLMVKTNMSENDSNAITPTEESGGLSARQRNAMKRRAKQSAKGSSNKVRIIDYSNNSKTNEHRQSISESGDRRSSIQEPGPNATDYFSVTPQSDQSRMVMDYKPAPPSPASMFQNPEQSLVWPFQRICEQLLQNFFDPRWECRHGANLGMREIMRACGASAGRVVSKSKVENDKLNQRYLENVACHLCCVFARDRFGDYVSDEVIAPVRESASQALGSVLVHADLQLTTGIYTILREMVLQTSLQETLHSPPIWEVCQGGMLGLKYLVAVRKDVFLKNDSILKGVVEAVIHGLSNFDDDVRSVSAATILPITEEFVKLMPQAIGDMIKVVWDCLSHLKDDLSASTGSVMDLLSKLCSFPQVLAEMRRRAVKDADQSFAQLMPLLYPFFRHTITSVRAAAIRAVMTFLHIGDEQNAGVDGRLLRLVFQILLVERSVDVLDLSLQLFRRLIGALKGQDRSKLKSEFGPHLHPLISLLFTPIGEARSNIPMEASYFLKPSRSVYSLPTNTDRRGSFSGEPNKDRARRKSEKHADPYPSQSTLAHNIDAPMMLGDVQLVGIDAILRCRVAAATALGVAIQAWPESSCMADFAPIIHMHMDSPFAICRYITTIVIEECREADDASCSFPAHFTDTLLQTLSTTEHSANADVVPLLRIVRSQCQALLAAFRETAKIPASKLPTFAVVVQGDADAGPSAFTLASAAKLVGEEYDKLRIGLTPSAKAASAKSLTAARDLVCHSMEEFRVAKEHYDVRIAAGAASAIVAMTDLPKKLTPVIRGLMDSIKLEPVAHLQYRSAARLAQFIRLCSISGKQAAADKLVTNLCAFLCVDTAEVPEFHRNEDLVDAVMSLRKEEDRKDHKNPVTYEKEMISARLQRQGAYGTLTNLCNLFGSEFFIKLPKILDVFFGPLREYQTAQSTFDLKDPKSTLGQGVVDGLSVLKDLVGQFHPSLYPEIASQLDHIVSAIGDQFAVIRYAASKCFAAICMTIRSQGMVALIEKILPMLNNPHELAPRQGAIETIYHLVHMMEMDILPYVIFLLVPVLGRMSDPDKDVRLLATTAFATIIKLVPLEAGIPDPPDLPPHLLEGRERERTFVSQMLNPSKVDQFDLPVTIKADLRRYQQDGVNWLAFLNKYQLHGILCDDMGLGKTLQTICIIASDHHIRAEQFAKTNAPEMRRLPSLVICPPTLAGHWQHEIATYAPFLSSQVYIGSPADRMRALSSFPNVDVVITSYEIARNDIGNISAQKWNYCVLDEGHVIKNSKAKLTQAVKCIVSNHRLILSGTPIQNNVLELWSLFDFLMPGFLGTEKVFTERFAKPIALSRNSKSSSKEQEAGALALEGLHRQVLPFLLRRLKEDVLSDLPPKIIQDYYCELSKVQKDLYDDFAKTQAPEREEAEDEQPEAKQHIFQALQYMRKLCNHPALVLSPKHPRYEEIKARLAREGSGLRDIAIAPKLGALKGLLQDCGIGVEDSDTGGMKAMPEAVSQHRALIFCQLKEMADMVENDVLKKCLPNVSYTRLDGSVDARHRHGIVQNFNADPSIDVMILTTQVGGLGLNLTGADTVIFVEHDWNPMKDLQAMDRAHRIGQKKVVNVYRLITRGTLEEKIMGLQRFKLNIASTVINQQNAGLNSMDTDQIFDLFNAAGAPALEAPSKEDDDAGKVDAEGKPAKKGSKNVLDNLSELWDEKQYDEYNLDNFIERLKK